MIQPYRAHRHGGSAPATPGFNAVAPEWLCYGAALAAPAVPAAESTLGSHPCVALSSAQVSQEWTTSTSPRNDFSASGDNPLNFMSHEMGSLQTAPSNTESGLDVTQAVDGGELSGAILSRLIARHPSLYRRASITAGLLT